LIAFTEGRSVFINTEASWINAPTSPSPLEPKLLPERGAAEVAATGGSAAYVPEELAEGSLEVTGFTFSFFEEVSPFPGDALATFLLLAVLLLAWGQSFRA